MAQSDVGIVSGIDDNYVYPFLIMLNSARKNTLRKLNVSLGYNTNSLSSQSKKKVTKIARVLGTDINWIELNFNLETNIPTGSHITEASYFRLLLADNLPETFLWLDSDIILFENWDSIFEFNDHNLSETIAFAVQDPIVVEEHDFKESNSAVRLAGKNYFNAGVVIIDPKLWRNNQLDVIWKNLISDYSKLGFMFQDQDILNYVLLGKTKMIPLPYNHLVTRTQASYETYPYIAHFAGAIKPWHIPPYFLWRLPSETRHLYQAYYYYIRDLIFKVAKKDPILSLFLIYHFLKSFNLSNLTRVIFHKLKSFIKNF
jgi:lipopolysaccharide biosynthesis glycosyltransferase